MHITKFIEIMKILNTLIYNTNKFNKYIKGNKYDIRKKHKTLFTVHTKVSLIPLTIYFKIKTLICNF
jgi:hypothetical protein